MAYQFKKGSYGYVTHKDAPRHTVVHFEDEHLQAQLKCGFGSERFDAEAEKSGYRYALAVCGRIKA